MKSLNERFDGTPCVKGVWLSSGSHVAADLAAEAGFDWAMLDMEHGMDDLSGMLLKSGMSAEKYMTRGFSIMAMGRDVSCLKYQKMLNS